MKQPYLAKLLFLLLFVCAGFTGAFAQTGSVSGRVVDEKSAGLPGVTVIIEGTTLGNSTNSDGTYSIQNVPAGPRTLVISFVGYTTGRVPVTVTAGQNTAVASTTLNENTTLLNEAVVVGYGTVRKQDVTGSVTSVSSRDFVQGQVNSPEQLINGKVAGVQISTSGGAPGAASVIRIRGGSSLNASNDPLIVIDGVPIDNSELRGSSNALSLINPNDIETFTVLKDASATAIYGSRASNGVILITTKKGLSGEKVGVNVSSLFSLSTSPRRVEVLSGDEFRALINRVGTEDQKSRLGSANTDWQDVILRNAYTQDYNAAVTGSLGAVPLRVSVGHLNADGIIKTNNLKRNTLSVGLNPVLLGGNLKVDANVKGSWIDNRFVEDGIIGSAVSFDPTQPVTLNGSPFGGFNEYYTQDATTGAIGVVGLAPTNPLARLSQRRDRSTVKRAIGNIQLDYKLFFLPDLRANLNLGYDLTRSNGSTFVPAGIAASEFNRGGVGNFYSQERDNKLLEFYLNYSKDLGNAGRLELLGGYSYQDFLRKSPPVPDLRADGTPASPNIVLPVRSQNTLISFYGRLNYNFKDRYLFTATLRNDNSSRFSKDFRAGYFPAAAVAWRVKGENFLANSTFLSELKFRAGYGITGQQEVFGNDYPSLAFYNPGENTVQYPVGGVFVNTLRPVAYDRSIKWEETTTYNAGLDYGFVDGRLTGTVDVYLRKTKDLLNETDASAGTNLSNRFLTNVGSLENRGVELGLIGVVAQTTDFNWSLNANATFNRNKITDVPNPTGLRVSGVDGGTGNRISINTVGFPVNTYYVYQQKYANDKPIVPTNANGGLNAFVDQNNDGQINELDLVRYKSPNPKAILGLGSNATFKRATLAFTMRAYLGNYAYNNIESSRGNLNAFLPTNPFLRNTTPGYLETGFTGEGTSFLLSDYFIQDASFLRMDNISLGYDLGETSNIRVTAAVQNAFIVTKFDTADPEKFDGTSPGVVNNVYPRPRTFTLGVNVNF
jgi:TonB-linked SusC/RagA family outer membrane protein